MSYGFCPHCGAEVATRERRLNGNDTCRGGHVYPSRLTLASKPPEAATLLRDVNQFLGEMETSSTSAVMIRGRIRSIRETIDAHLSKPAAAGRVA